MAKENKQTFLGAAATLGAAVGAIAHLGKVRPRRTRTMFGPAYTYNTRTASGEWLRMLVVNGGCQGFDDLDIGMFQLFRLGADLLLHVIVKAVELNDIPQPPLSTHWPSPE